MQHLKQHILRHFASKIPPPLQRPLWQSLITCRRLLWKLRNFIPGVLLRRLPGSSLQLGPPRHIAVTVEEATGLATCIEAFPAGQAPPIQPPQNHIRPDGKLLIDSLLTHRDYEAAKIAVLENARVYGNNGAVISSSDQVIAELSMEMARAFSPETLPNHSIYSQWRLPPPTQLGGLTVNLLALSVSNYYHWMLFSLPKVALLPALGIEPASVDHWIIPASPARFHIETLRMLGIPPEKCVSTSPRGHFQTQRLAVSTPYFLKHGIPSWLSTFMRDLAHTHRTPTSPVASRRLYISRKGASYRRVLNEDDLQSRLQSRGFQTVQGDDFTVAEQMALFAEADLIVAVHGAALANLAFCRPSTILIELFAGAYVNNCYAVYATQTGLRYGAVIDQTTEAQGNLAANLQVDLDALDQILDQFDA